MDDAVGEVLGGRADHGERRAQLVRDSGHELHLLPGQPLRAPGGQHQQAHAGAEQAEHARADQEVSASLRADGSFERARRVRHHELPVGRRRAGEARLGPRRRGRCSGVRSRSPPRPGVITIDIGRDSVISAIEKRVVPAAAGGPCSGLTKAVKRRTSAASGRKSCVRTWKSSAVASACVSRPGANDGVDWKTNVRRRRTAHDGDFEVEGGGGEVVAGRALLLS